MKRRGAATGGEVAARKSGKGEEKEVKNLKRKRELEEEERQKQNHNNAPGGTKNQEEPRERPWERFIGGRSEVEPDSCAIL